MKCISMQFLPLYFFFVPYVKEAKNQSLTTGFVPDSYKLAIVKQLLKKPGLNEDLNIFSVVSNLNLFSSKLLKRAVLC